jgi:hypothetical protein
MIHCLETKNGLFVSNIPCKVSSKNRILRMVWRHDGKVYSQVQLGLVQKINMTRIHGQMVYFVVVVHSKYESRDLPPSHGIVCDKQQNLPWTVGYEKQSYKQQQKENKLDTKVVYGM